jgi:hypothetical protein
VLKLLKAADHRPSVRAAVFDRLSTSDDSARGGGDPTRLQIASDCARRLHSDWRQLRPRDLLTALKQISVLVWFLRSLPQTTVRLTDEPTGLVIAEHLSLTRWGIPRFRLAQGVLHLPADLASYLRGRRRQAVRTNIHHARDLGIECQSTSVADWTRPGDELTRSASVEHWWATGCDGATIGEAWVTVDDECALLHSLVCRERAARWLLHTAIVERLCAAGCRVLLTNSFDVPLMAPGVQYFQRLLGYSVARVRLQPNSGLLEVRRRLPLMLVSLVATSLIVAQDNLQSPLHLAGHRALVWLVALVAVRIAADRAGWATLVGAGAALGTLLTGAAPAASLAYLLCGLSLDAVLVLLPGIAQSSIAMACAGPLIMFVTVVAPAFPTVGHHHVGDAWQIPPVLGAVLFGAAAAIAGRLIGQYIGQQTRRAAGAHSARARLRLARSRAVAQPARP